MTFEIEVYNRFNLPDKAKTSTCPLCSHTRKKSKEKCLMLDWERGLGTCQHCGEVIQLHTYKSSKEDKREYKHPAPISTYELSDKVLSFFESRGISQRALRIAKVSEGIDWMPQYQREIETIHFNYFDNGILINTKYRAPQKAFKMESGAKLILSGIDRWKYADELVLVEGEIDELSFIEAGINHVASVPNGATKGNQNLDYIDNCYDYLENKEKIYLCVDDDEAGESLKKELVRRLGADRCLLIDLKGYKDANEALMDKGVEYLTKCYYEAEYLPLENVSTYQDEVEDFYDLLINDVENGKKIGIPSFDSNFSTYTGQYIIITGIPGHGKSDFVDMMALGYSLTENYKIGYASVENKYKNNLNILHTRKLFAKLYGRFPTVDDIGTKDFMLCEMWLNDYISYINFEGSYYLEDVLRKGEELVKRKGIKVFVIDPFNKVILKGRKRDEDSYVPDYLNKIDDFGRRNDVITIIVAHPVKPKENNGKMLEPNMYSIRGTGDFYDMAYHGLSVYKDDEYNYVKIKNLKVKFSHLGISGESSYLAWNPENGRYSELIGEPEFGDFEPVFNNNCWLNNPVKKIKENEEAQQQPETNALPYSDYDEECGF